MNETESLFAKAVDPDSVHVDPKSPRYTTPKTWGVYKADRPRCTSPGIRFHKGNHPVRLNELKRKYRYVNTVVLFDEEALATRLRNCLNQG